MFDGLRASRYRVPACPRCNNRDAHLISLEPAIQNPTVDILSCHCGKCAHIFEQMVERQTPAVFSCPSPAAEERQPTFA
jgi:hypothetical protein